MFVAILSFTCSVRGVCAADPHQKIIAQQYQSKFTTAQDNPVQSTSSSVFGSNGGRLVTDQVCKCRRYSRMFIAVPQDVLRCCGMRVFGAVCRVLQFAMGCVL